MTTPPLTALYFQNTTFEALGLQGPRFEKNEATAGSSLPKYFVPQAPWASALGALGSTLWYGLSYSGPSSAPWQGIVGSFGAGVLAAPFEAYENYTLYRLGKRSLSHSLLDGVTDTVSAGVASYIGSSLASLFVSSAARGGLRVPFRFTFGSSLAAAVIAVGVWYGLSAVKEGLFKDLGIS